MDDRSHDAHDDDAIATPLSAEPPGEPVSAGASRGNRTGAADQVRTLIRRARTLVEPLDSATFNRRPEPDRWSVGECIEHLNATARLYLPVLAEAIEGARERGLADRRRDGRTLLGRILVWTQEPPVRFRMKTWTEIEPESGGSEGLDPDSVLEEFEALHEELIVRINESSDLDCRRIKVRSALDRRLKLSLGDWFAFLAAHGRRHTWQAEQVVEALEVGTPPG